MRGVQSVPESDEVRVAVQYTEVSESLGFQLIGKKLGATYIVRAKNVVPNCSAARQGLRSNDILDRLNGDSVENTPVAEVGSLISRCKRSRKGVFTLGFRRDPVAITKKLTREGTSAPAASRAQNVGSHQSPFVRPEVPPPPPAFEEVAPTSRQGRRAVKAVNVAHDEAPPPGDGSSWAAPRRQPRRSAAKRASESSNNPTGFARRAQRRASAGAAPFLDDGPPAFGGGAGAAPPGFSAAPPGFSEAPPGFGEAPPGFSEAPPDFGGGGAAPPGFGDERSRSRRKSKSRRKRSGGDDDGTQRARRKERRRGSRSERSSKSSRRRDKQSRAELHKAADVATTRMTLRVREVQGQLRHELLQSTEESLMLVLGEMAEQSKSLTASLDNVQEQSAMRAAAMQQSVMEQMQAMSIDQRAQSSAIELQLHSMRQDLFAQVANVRTTAQQSTKEREIARDAAGRGANLREQLQLWEASTLPSLGFELHPPITGFEGVGVPWRCLLPGRRATVHDGALYTMRMHFSKEYPRTPPLCKIDPPLQWHPNIDKTSGDVQLPMLSKEGWMGHRYSIADIAANVQQLLHSAHIEGATNAAAASLFTDSPYALKSRLRTESQNPSVLKCRTRPPGEASANAVGSRPQIVPWKNLRPLTSSGDRMRLHIDART